MVNQFSRTELLYGEESVRQLKDKRVAVFGVGGVGGYVCEALCRSGIGRNDTDNFVCIHHISKTNVH